jgi:hypothetical protein
LLGMCCHSCLLHLARFEGFPLPHSSALGCPTLFATCLFCGYCLLFSFFSLFSVGGGWSVHGAMLIWPRVVCGSKVPLISPCGPRLPKPSGRWHLAEVREPSWFLHLTWSGNAMRRLEVWRSQSFASSQWFFL